MPARAVISFDKLPLFIRNDNHLAEAIVGPDVEEKQTFLAGLPRLESQGFPRKVPGYGRYRPAVLQFYDRFFGLDASPAPILPEKPKGPIDWPVGRASRRIKRPTDK